MVKNRRLKNVLYSDLCSTMIELDLSICRDCIDGMLSVLKSKFYRDELMRLDGVLGFCGKHKLLSKEQNIELLSNLDKLIDLYIGKCNCDFY